MKKSILITGCSSGIGKAAAIALRDKGYQVFATARTEKDCAILNKENLIAVILDVASQNSIHQAYQEVVKHTEGNLYGLINNAGYCQTGAIEDLSNAAIQQQFAVNLFGPIELIRLIVPLMRKQGQGRIINISSISGLISYPYAGAYCATKYALEAITDALRIELADTNIRVSLIEPGPVATNFVNKLISSQENIDWKDSTHRKLYEQDKLLLPKLNRPGEVDPANIVKSIINALESKNPKIRYINFSVYKDVLHKRLLPERWFDAFMVRDLQRSIQQK